MALQGKGLGREAEPSSAGDMGFERPGVRDRGAKAVVVYIVFFLDSSQPLRWWMTILTASCTPRYQIEHDS